MAGAGQRSRQSAWREKAGLIDLRLDFKRSILDAAGIYQQKSVSARVIVNKISLQQAADSHPQAGFFQHLAPGRIHRIFIHFHVACR